MSWGAQCARLQGTMRETDWETSFPPNLPWSPLKSVSRLTALCVKWTTMWEREVFVTKMVKTRVSKLFSLSVLTRNRKLHNLLHRRPSFGMQNFEPGFCSSPFPNGQPGGTVGKPILSCTNITHQLLQSSVIEERSALPRLKGNLLWKLSLYPLFFCCSILILMSMFHVSTLL